MARATDPSRVVERKFTNHSNIGISADRHQLHLATPESEITHLGGGENQLMVKNELQGRPESH
jgi:hypothetical protein